jgi:hypothetical protein
MWIPFHVLRRSTRVKNRQMLLEPGFIHVFCNLNAKRQTIIPTVEQLQIKHNNI